ncbi:MAG: transposase [Planctomycetes bacterium]|nr:transposase [Planctomycetota bacterium]
MITEQKLSGAETARRLDVGENLLREWRKAFLAKGDAAFPGHGNPADDELRRLWWDRLTDQRLSGPARLRSCPVRTSPWSPRTASLSS